jgi:asparagine synthase (glutamine-hydrolysing)
MCGITGIVNLEVAPPIEQATLQQMIGALRHRGPDEFGLYRDEWAGLGSARLSIVDLEGGQQPIGNEDGSVWTVFNGEIFNYAEVHADLEARGHVFYTRCDTETVVHLYEEYGPGFPSRLNGQFALAVWDAPRRRLLLARDRMGIRPLFYTQQEGRLIFGSEVKAILTAPGVRAEIDPQALEQVFTYWSVQSPRSAFVGIQEVPPGHTLLAADGRISLQSYWQPDFTPAAERRSDEAYLEEFEHLLTDATRIRLWAYVPVGAYLSGGMDSSVVAALVHGQATSLDTFSIAFSEERYDESRYQRRMASHLGTRHHEVFCTHAQIAEVFPEVIWHTESPILRTAPAPLYLLSDLVHQQGYKVVLTGEGADEVLAGYDIFKEMRVRRFWARRPESELRPLLLRRLYPDIPAMSRAEAFRQDFFRQGLLDTESPTYSHAVRWSNTARLGRFLTTRGSIPSNGGPRTPVPLPPAFPSWSGLGQAQFLEMVTFLSPYLLSSQGDRMSMAHSVEGRYPFLDYRLVEFCGRLPDDVKQRGLTEKWLLRKVAQKHVPPEIWQRTKRPYRAPIRQTFFGEGHRPAYIDHLLSPSELARSEHFEPGPVTLLAAKARAGRDLSEIEEMALVGILSTQLLEERFVRRPMPPASVDDGVPWKIVEPAASVRQPK